MISPQDRSRLIVIQVLGGLTLLPYPFVLLATVMSIAAPGQTPAGALSFALLAAYPLVWAALYLLSWRALKRGAARLAFGMSAVPLLTGGLVLGFIMLSFLLVPFSLKSRMIETNTAHPAGPTGGTYRPSR